MQAFLKFFIGLFLIITATSCSKNDNPCQEPSQAYWTVSLFGKPHNTKIKGENRTIRKAFKDIMLEKKNIVPSKGYINLKLHLDKNGNFCSLESFEIDDTYSTTSFNNGKLIKDLEKIASSLEGWSNDTNTKTYYLIKFVINEGIIKEVF